MHLFYQLHGGKRFVQFQDLLDWYMKGFALDFHFVWGNNFHGFFLENRNFAEIRFISKTPHMNRIEKVMIK